MNNQFNAAYPEVSMCIYILVFGITIFPLHLDNPSNKGKDDGNALSCGGFHIVLIIDQFAREYLYAVILVDGQ